jgi:hypothetical protein
MKHITKVTQSRVAQAGEWEDVICVIAQTFNAILEFFGGSSPLVGYIGSKCEIPTPNEGGNQ